MYLRRRKAATSSAVRLNHSPFRDETQIGHASKSQYPQDHPQRSYAEWHPSGAIESQLSLAATDSLDRPIL